MSTGPPSLLPRGANPPRELIGIAISRGGRRAAAVRAVATGRGLESRIQIVGGTSRDVPEVLQQRLPTVAGGATPAAELPTLAAGLADVAASLVAEVSSVMPPAAALAIGVLDPGIWDADRGQTPTYLGLCDAARLAEATGLTVIDAFPARDVAGGGRGGPVEALAQWLLLHDAKKCRVLVDLGTTIRLTYLPASHDAGGASRVLAMEAGPGMALVDRLTARLTRGRQTVDLGGRLAVQGRRIPQLVARLFAAPYFEQPWPSWHPHGVCTDWFVEESMRLAYQAGWSIRDVLCSATHFLAEMVTRAIVERIPKAPPLDQLVIVGGGEHNGLLLRELSQHLADAPALRVGDLGVEADLFDAASAAGLALLHLDQVAANSTFITGASVPRVLGRLTPGAPLAWQRLLMHFSEMQPKMMSLRSAV